MGYIICKPDRRDLIRAGYAQVAHVPFLLRDDGTYPFLANRYLRARALCEWQPRTGTDGVPAKLRREFLTAKSCGDLVSRLKAFLTWCDREEHRPESLRYQDLLTWRGDLLDGDRKHQLPVQPATARLYVAEATFYLSWLSLVPRDSDGAPCRDHFEVPGESIHPTLRRVERNAPKKNPPTGKRRQRRTQLPSQIEVNRWLQSLRIRAPVKALIAEVMIDSGMRISEANQLRTVDFPEPSEWRPVEGRVFFTVTRGSKGRKRTPTSMESRPRDVSISVALALRVHAYKSSARETQVRRWIRAASSKPEQLRRSRDRPDRLWLSEHSNLPFDNRQMFHAWTAVAHCPAGWHPHAGRHWFAVEQLVEYGRRALAAAQSPVHNPSWLDGVLRNQVDLLLRPSMGHISASTTEEYLVAAKARLGEGTTAPSIRWNDLLDDDANSEGSTR
jgi:integrase